MSESVNTTRPDDAEDETMTPKTPPSQPVDEDAQKDAAEERARDGGYD